MEENNSEELSVSDMTELELELDAALVQTRLRKVIVRRYLFNSVSHAVTFLYVLNYLSSTNCVYT